MKYFLPFILIIFFITACDRVGSPAEVKNYGASGGSSLGVIQVYEGDNLYKLAQRYRISLRDLIEENNLVPPYKLAKGQRLNIPAPRIYTAKEGDSYASIARLYDLSITELVQQNNSQAPHMITAGQNIYLSKSKREARVQEQKRQIASSRQIPKRTVAQQKKQVSKRTQAPGTLVYQQTYEPPVAAPQPLDAPTYNKQVMNKTIDPMDMMVDPQDVPQGMPQEMEPLPVALAQPSAKTIEQVKSKTKINTPPARSGSKFNWPVQGKVLSRYGGKQGGLFNDGINIGVPEGTTVRAAENGVVAYVGHDLKGFGNLVLVKHDDGYMTAYAHLSKSLVQRGTVLKKGQTLGTVGKTGSVNTPQIHFEIRKDGKPIDPSKYLI